MSELRDHLEILIRIAHESGAPSDYQALFSALYEEELYFSTSEDGEYAALTPVNDNQKAVRLVTSHTSHHLGKVYAGIKWEDALRMVEKMPEASGIIVQNSSDHWIAIDQEAVKALLSLST